MAMIAPDARHFVPLVLAATVAGCSTERVHFACATVLAIRVDQEDTTIAIGQSFEPSALTNAGSSDCGMKPLAVYPFASDDSAVATTNQLTRRIVGVGSGTTRIWLRSAITQDRDLQVRVHVR